MTVEDIANKCISVENPVWEVYPLATHFGGGSGKKAWSEIYEDDSFDAKVIGEGPTYEAAWKDATQKIQDALCVCDHPRIKHRNEDGGEMAGSECLWCDCPGFRKKETP